MQVTRWPAGWLLCCLAGAGLPGCEPGATRAAARESGKSTPPEAPALSLAERTEKAGPALRAQWTREARILARATDPELEPATSSADVSTEQWGSELENRLAALLISGGEPASWATFGLGLRCRHKPERLFRTLATATAAWATEPVPPSPEGLSLAAWALGGCGSPDAERVLLPWLDPHPGGELPGVVEAAAEGLGKVADEQRTLTERTQAALIAAAVRRKDGSLLYPLSRLPNLDPAVGAHLLEVSAQLLAESQVERRLVILALGSAGPLAKTTLAQIVGSGKYAPAERSAAAQALRRLGAEGHDALDEALRDLLARGLPGDAKSPLWAPLRAALEGVDLPVRSTPELRKLASLNLPRGDTPLEAAQRRRLLWLRCRAADLVARDHSLSSRLAECDPDHGEPFDLAQVRVLSRSRIEGKRLPVFHRLSKHENPRVRQAALRLIPGHPELEDVRSPLVLALTSDNAGNQATAAKILAAYPARAHAPGGDGTVDERVIAGLKGILERKEACPVETLSAAVSAAGALSSLTLKPSVEAHCESPHAPVRGAAERALALLGNPKKKCPGPAFDPQSLQQPAPPPTPPVRVSFDSPFGELNLVFDEPHTEKTRARVLEAFQAGHYARGPVHGVSPGTFVQFGDPDGDGFEAQALPPDATELGPSPFTASSVGVSTFSGAAAGLQLFVTLSEAPQLRGRRVRLGHASGPWDLLWPDDPLGPATVRQLE